MNDYCFFPAVKSKQDYQVIIAIPICAEYNFIFKTIQSLKQNSPQYLARSLCVLYINNKIKDIKSISSFFINNTRLWQKRNFFKDSFLSFLVYDAFSNKKRAFNNKLGVGRAREQAFKKAYKYTNKRPLCIWLDADTLVPKNYLETIVKEMKGKLIAHCRFKHQKATNTHKQKAIEKYEKFMHNYVNGLSEAGSTYAYHSIGSTIVCQWQVFKKCYQVLSKRTAGEDFYFLQYARKLFGPIYEIPVTIFPSARASNRVPFGTGIAIEKLRKKNFNTKYSTETFQNLKTFLHLLKEKNLNLSENDINNHNLNYYLEFFKKIKLFQYLEKWKTQYKTTNTRQKAINDFFDALKQQQFLSYNKQKL